MPDIEKMALLARIKLDQNEKTKFQKEFEAILNYISKLKEVNIEKIEEEKRVLENVMREDANPHQPAEFSKDLLKQAMTTSRQAPSIEKNYVKVKHVFE